MAHRAGTASNRRWTWHLIVHCNGQQRMVHIRTRQTQAGRNRVSMEDKQWSRRTGCTFQGHRQRNLNPKWLQRTRSKNLEDRETQLPQCSMSLLHIKRCKALHQSGSSTHLRTVGRDIAGC